MPDKESYVPAQQSRWSAALHAFLHDDMPTEKEEVGFLFGDRAALIADLLALKRRPHIPLASWIAEVQARLRKAGPAFESFAAALDGPPQAGPVAGTSQTREPIDESFVNDILDRALRTAEVHPIVAFGPDMRHLLVEMVDRAVTRAAPARALRWTLPALIAAVLGGTVWGSVELRGLLNEIQNSRKTAQDALVTFDKNLNAQATSLLSQEKAKAEAIGTSAANALPGYYKEQKVLFLAAQEASGSKILNARLDAILTDFDDKKKEAEKSAKALQDAIAAAMESSRSPALIKQIRDDVDKLGAEVGGLKALAKEVRELRQTLDTASGGSRLSPLQLLTIFQLKDVLAITALIIAVIAALFAVVRSRRAVTGLTIMVGIFVAAGIVGLLALCVMVGLS